MPVERRAAGRWTREGRTAGKQIGASVRFDGLSKAETPSSGMSPGSGGTYGGCGSCAGSLAIQGMEGREDPASSSLFSGSSPCGSPEDGRASPLSGEPPTGEPCAGDPHARFGGRGDRVINRSSLPLSWLLTARRDGKWKGHPVAQDQHDIRISETQDHLRLANRFHTLKVPFLVGIVQIGDHAVEPGESLSGCTIGGAAKSRHHARVIQIRSPGEGVRGTAEETHVVEGIAALARRQTLHRDGDQYQDQPSGRVLRQQIEPFREAP